MNINVLNDLLSDRSTLYRSMTGEDTVNVYQYQYHMDLSLSLACSGNSFMASEMEIFTEASQQFTLWVYTGL